MTTNSVTTKRMCRWCPKNKGKPINPDWTDGVCDDCGKRFNPRYKPTQHYEVKNMGSHFEVKVRKGTTAYWCWTEQEAQQWISAHTNQEAA